MKNLLLLLVLGFSSLFTFSQSPAPPMQFGSNDGLISSNHRFDSKAPKGEISYEEALAEYEKIQGSPFLHGGYITVDLTTAKDSILKSVTILYDLYNQEIVAKPKKGGTIILDQLYYKGFIYNNKGIEEIYLRVHPADLKFYKVLFQNEDFIFCKADKISISDDTRYIPGQDSKSKKFVSQTRYYIYNGKKVNEVILKNELLVNHLPNKYKSKVQRIKRKLNIKKLKKEKDYLLLMDEF